MVVSQLKNHLMSEMEYRVDLIEVLETGIFKTEHVFHAKASILGNMSLKGNKMEGHFRGADGSEMSIKKTNFWKSAYELRIGEELIAIAQKRKIFSPTYVIQKRGNLYGLTPGGNKSRSWRLLNNNKQELCEFQPRGVFKKGAKIFIKADIPIEIMVLSYTLVILRWQERSA